MSHSCVEDSRRYTFTRVDHNNNIIIFLLSFIDWLVRSQYLYKITSIRIELHY